MGDGFGGGVADALVVANGFLVRCHAVGAALLSQDLAEGEDTDAQRADAVALLGVQGRGGRQGEGGGGLLAVPGDELFLQHGRRGEVAVVVAGQVDTVAHDQAVAVFPAGDGRVVRRAVVGHDLRHQPGPFGGAALVVVEDAQALHGGDDAAPTSRCGGRRGGRAAGWPLPAPGSG